MGKTFLFLVFIPCCIVCGITGPMLGKGTWKVLNMMRCENDEDYEFKIDIIRRKIDRTHDGFSADVFLDFVLTVEDYGIRIEICQYVDGGCKHYQTVIDDSLCQLINNNNSRPNFEAILTNAGVDPPNCPLQKGEINVKDYIVDYKEFPPVAVYGVYDARWYLTNEGRHILQYRYL